MRYNASLNNEESENWSYFVHMWALNVINYNVR